MRNQSSSFRQKRDLGEELTPPEKWNKKDPEVEKPKSAAPGGEKQDKNDPEVEKPKRAPDPEVEKPKSAPGGEKPKSGESERVAAVKRAMNEAADASRNGQKEKGNQAGQCGFV